MVTGQKFDEPVMTFTEAAGWCERRFGRRPNAATIWRWAIKGSRGVRLRTISLGRYRYTTERALERFIEETSGGAPGAPGSLPAEVAPAGDQPEFAKSELAAARRRREADKEKAKAFLRQNLGSSRGQAVRKA